MGKETSKFCWILSEKFVLEDFTLKAQRNFDDAVNTCALSFVKKKNYGTLFEESLLIQAA